MSHQQCHHLNTLRQMHQSAKSSGNYQNKEPLVKLHKSQEYIFTSNKDYFLIFSNLEFFHTIQVQKSRKKIKSLITTTLKNKHGYIAAFFFQTISVHFYLHSCDHTVYIIQYIALNHLMLQHMHFSHVIKYFQMPVAILMAG